MMYSNNLVVAIKHGGKVLREQGDAITLPFGAEYSVYVKNLSGVRAQVAVSVDGQSALGSSRLVLGPNESVDLERFVRNGNMREGNRFKFIERTGAVEAHRGVGVEDGLVRVEMWKERAVPPPPVLVPYYPNPLYPVLPMWQHPDNNKNVWNGSGGVLRSNGFRSFDSGNVGMPMQNAGMPLPQVQFCSAMQSAAPAAPVNDAGITAPGSLSNQTFGTVASFALESSSSVVVVRLRGEVGGQVVQAPLLVKQHRQCVSCGKQNKSTHGYCTRCGTALELKKPLS